MRHEDEHDGKRDGECDHHGVLDDGRVRFRYRLPESGERFAAEIRCPLPTGCHPAAEALRAQHRHWADRFALLPDAASRQRFHATRFDQLAAFQCHDLPLAAAALHSHLMSWFFVFDDLMDIDHRLDDAGRAGLVAICERHLAILGGAPPRAGDLPCVQAFADFLQQAGTAASAKTAGWFERLRHHLREYIAGASWESRIGPTTGANANTAFYLQVRHLSVGVAPCLDLMAMSAGIDPVPLVGNCYVQRLERLAINYSIWVNDLAGLNRDLRRGLGNVVFTLQRDLALSLPAATQRVARLCDDELAAFLQVEAQLPMLLGDAGAGIPNPAYAGVLKRWMRGLLDWSARSARYRRDDIDMALQDDATTRRTAALGRLRPD